VRAIDPLVPEWDVVRQAFDHDECAALRDAIAEDAFSLADIAYSAGARVDAEVRNNDRAVLLAPALAETLFARIGPALPRVVHERALVGLAPRLRYYRYRSGQRFAPHRDGIELGENGTSSLLTVLIALQRAERGGDTHFIRARERVHLVEGDVLWFQHPLLHEGCTVEAGEKLLLRTDALFGGSGN
jgi:prolyl 4-hydroxylase